MIDALKTLGNMDFACRKKFFDWTLSHLDAEEYEEDLKEKVEREDIAVKTIIEAFKKILNDNMVNDDQKFDEKMKDKDSPKYAI